MDNENKAEILSENTPKKKNTANRVVLVQVAVCIFLVLLVVISGKLVPQTFEFIKSEYNLIMSQNIDSEKLVKTVKNAAEKVITQEKNDVAEDKISDIPPASGGEDIEVGEIAVAAMAVADDGQITVPLHGRITSKYGYRTNPITGKYSLHTGVDIAADEGSSIVAAYGGVIKDTGTGEKKGNYVLMEHENGTQTLYCHCSKVLVDEGTVIRAGEVIALVGSTGWSTGPHLHFEIQKNGKTVDPLTLLSEKSIEK